MMCDAPYEVELHTADGRPLAAVVVPSVRVLPAVLSFRARVFVLGIHGTYREVVAHQCFTKEEYESMKREGILR